MKSNPRNTQLQPGQKFGHYEILSLLGKGGMGEVYAVRHTTLGGKFALKVINAEITERPEALERFRLEARAGYELDHPNIVRAQEFGDVDGRYFLRMQLMPGIETDQGIAVSLEDLQKKRGGRLEEKEAVKYIEQILNGLKFAHEHGEGMIHRDLKPANILLSSEGAKIADFGLVKAAGEDWMQSRVHLTLAMTQFIGKDNMNVENAITKFAQAEGLDIEDQKTMPVGTTAGAFMGTYDFMAPEQKEGRAATVQSDLYAVGLMAFSMLTGEKTLGMSLPSEIIPSLNKSWDEWVKKAVNSNPQKRFSSASEMLDALLPSKVKTVKSATAAAIEPEPKERTVKKTDPRRRKSPVGLSLLILMLVVVSFMAGIYFLGNGKQETEDRRQNAETRSQESEEGRQNVEDSIQKTENRIREKVAEKEEIKLSETKPKPAKVSEEIPVAVTAGVFHLKLDPPVAEAKVWIVKTPIQGETVVNGVAEFSDIPEGEHEIYIDVSGYENYNNFFIVKDGVAEYTARLIPIKAELLVEADPGTTVTAISEKGPETLLGTTDKQGQLKSKGLLTIGDYTFRLEKPNHEIVVTQKTELHIGKVEKIKADLEPLPGELTIFSTPSGADIFLNGKKVGQTPKTLKKIRAEKEHTIEIRRSGYRQAIWKVTLKAGEKRKPYDFGVMKAESGKLQPIVSNWQSRTETERKRAMSRIKILVDEQETAMEEGILVDLEIGERSIKVQHPDYEEWSGRAEVIDEQTSKLAIKLKPKPAELKIETDANVSYTLEVDGEKVTGKNNRYKMPAEKELRLKLNAKGYRSAGKTIKLPANGEQIWQATMEEIKGADPGENWTLPELGLQIVWIEPGTFTMGSPGSEAKRDNDEGPQTEVRLTSGYWLGKYEVTQGEYAKIMGNNPSGFKDAGKRAPVEKVSWDEAMEFSKKITAREHRAGRLPEGYAYTLPTEAQWEYACRAGTTTPFGIGDGRNLSSQEANFNGNYPYGNSNKGKYMETTVEVGSYKPNRWGLYDMHGNVWEWCLDRYEDSLPGGSVSNPEGATSGTYRVDRGGSWIGFAQRCRSAFRYGDAPDYRRYDLGFRLVLSSVP